MNRLITKLDDINEKAGRIFSWSASLLVWLICIDVIMRYVFNYTLIWILELESYLFACIFLLASGYAFKYDRHVRVDLFYANYSKKSKAWTNFLGGVFFLLPWTIVSCYVCFYYFLKSYNIGESSSQPGGLPALYVLKFILFLGFVLLFIQAVSSILKSFLIIIDKDQEKDALQT